MVILLARIVYDGTTLIGLRDALNGLHDVRDSALPLPAYRAWDEARQIVGDDLYALAEQYGLHGAAIPASI